MTVHNLASCGFAAGLWSLDDKRDPETQEVLGQADAQPDNFVLKPQREGGGNNLYGEALQRRIADPRGLAAYILMQRIRPPINRFLTAQCPLLNPSTIALSSGGAAVAEGRSQGAWPPTVSRSLCMCVWGEDA